jgi:hypothetical protein
MQPKRQCTAINVVNKQRCKNFFTPDGANDISSLCPLHSPRKSSAREAIRARILELESAERVCELDSTRDRMRGQIEALEWVLANFRLNSN